MPEFVSTPSNPRFQDLTGQQFGRLTVLGFAGQRKKLAWFWCQCSCGSVPKAFRADRLKRRVALSCGCYRKERAFKHGGVGTAEYLSWAHMLRRCLDPKNKDYFRYGGRGITIAESWLDFANFRADMGKSLRASTLWKEKIIMVLIVLRIVAGLLRQCNVEIAATTAC